MSPGAPENSSAQQSRRRRRTRICYAGTYEREYPRNILMVEALREAGAKVEEAHVSVFERLRDKSDISLPVLMTLVIRLIFAYLRLVPEVTIRLLRCDALAIGYIGQLDMLILGTLARFLRKPVIFNPLVTLTGTLVDDRRMIKSGSIAARLFRFLDILSFRIASHVITDTGPNATFLQERFSVPGEKLVVVPVGADEVIFYPRKPHLQTEEFDVLFYGKFIPLHGVETIVKAAALLNDRNHPVRFELVGIGQDRERAIQLAADLGAQNIIWTDWIPFSKLGDRIRRADVILGIFSGGPKAGRVVPNKVYQAMACARPVLTRSSPALAWLLNGEEAALLVPPEDPEALAEAIVLLNDATLREQIGKEGYRTWRMKASIPALAKRLTPLVTSLSREGLPDSQST